jgi:hypothetical protein
MVAEVGVTVLCGRIGVSDPAVIATTHARGVAVPKSHGRLSKHVEEVDFAWLFRRFDLEYGDAYVQLAAQLRQSYPEITKPSRRTGRALRNICFFVWCCCREGDQELIPTLFRAAVLLAAQDDYYDNPRIPDAQKEAFCTATNRALRTDRADAFRRDFESSAQLRDLVSLWTYVARTIPQSAPQVRSYWIATACQMNAVMAAENQAVRRGTITYEEYMRTAIQSIGIVFIWATWLAHEHVPMTTLLEMAPVLVQGATVVRLSNDMASYRLGKNKENAVTLLGGSSPELRIRGLVTEEAHAFRQSVEALYVQSNIRDFLLHSVDFLREFYRRTDFDRGPNW